MSNSDLNARRRAKYEAKKAAGICVDQGCKNHASDTTVYCEPHAVVKRKQDIERIRRSPRRQQQRRDAREAYRLRLKANGYCRICKRKELATETLCFQCSARWRKIMASKSAAFGG